LSKIALISDTTADLNKETIEKYNINVLSFRIIYKDKEFKDGIDISPEEVYRGMSVEVPTSSLPSMQDMEELYVRLENEGYTHAIAIPLSTGLSGIYNALKLVSDNHPNINTCLFDSKSISMGEGALVEACGELIQAGKSFEEIVEFLPGLQQRIHLYFVVDTLEYLKKGGRIGKVSGTIAELLNIKPIISVDRQGIYYTHDKVRGRKQSLNRIVEIGSKILDVKKCKVYIMNGYCLPDAQKVYNDFSKLPNVTSVVFGGDISPVSGVHSGPGLVGVVLVEEA